MQKKKKILKELQKVERQLQLKTQQQFTKEYMEAKGLKEEQEAGQSQGPGPGPGSTSPPGPLPIATGAQVHTSSDTDEDANKDGKHEELPGEDGEEVTTSMISCCTLLTLDLTFSLIVSCGCMGPLCLL